MNHSEDEILDDKDFTLIGTYSLKFLSVICKSSGLCNNISIYLKPSFPILFEYSVAALGTIKIGISSVVIT